MTDLEDRFVAECRRQGFQPDQHAMQKAAINFCGAKLTSQGLIHLPNVGTISPADFVRSLHSQTPESFAALQDQPSIKPATNLTEGMRQEVAASRKRSLPDDFQSVRARYSADSITGKMMDEIAASRRASKEQEE